MNNNTWVNSSTGKRFEQNNYLLKNNGTRNVCDVVLAAPVTANVTAGGSNNSTAGALPPFYSAYNVQSCSVSGGAMHLTFPSWAKTVYANGGVVPFGYILEGKANMDACVDSVVQTFSFLRSLTCPLPLVCSYIGYWNKTATGAIAHVINARFCDDDSAEAGTDNGGKNLLLRGPSNRRQHRVRRRHLADGSVAH